MDYQFKQIESNWQRYWAENKVFKAESNSSKPKYYVLDMFPYPSGAGLHVGHPLGYIATDIFSRYKRLKGFNVLHPMGYDSFGLPAEQYAIQTGQHPAITTAQNVARYREQLDRIGFSYDWDREVMTSDPSYYRWTQWIFKELFNSWYNNESDKAEDIATLVAKFEKEGNANVQASQHEQEIFTAEEWKGYSEEKQQNILLNYRLAYLADSWVNWCPALGTVLANDEVKDGFSERGGYPVEQKLMRQWSMRITAYAERLLTGLDHIDWPEPVKEMQRNWIGRSKGSSLRFSLTLNPASLTLNPSPKERDLNALGEDDSNLENSTASEPFIQYTNRPNFLLINKSIADKLVEFARYYRSNQTEAEELLWEQVRNKKIGHKIRHQHPIGKFIADFICITPKLIIEIDGGIHNEEEQKQYDEMRTFVLNELGFDVIRFSNEEIKNEMKVVISKIKFKIEERITELGANILSDIDESDNYNNRISEITAGSNPSPLEKGRGEAIEVFTTRPDTVFGVSFLVLAPEHELVNQITTADCKEAVEAYKKASAIKTERDRMSDVKTISGVFTGSYVKHPFSNENIPVWIGDYVLASYGTGAVMAVPAHDTRDYAFAKHFNLPIKQVVEGGDISVEAYDAKEGKIINSDFLNGLEVKEAMQKIIEEIEKRNLGKGKINYRLRDAVFGRQRYWGEPIPVYYKNGLPYLVDDADLPLELPAVDKFLPTESGEPPLARASNWKYKNEFEYELSTMPGWAGSSWYFLRYMDPKNEEVFASKESLAYWNQVDLYIGGSEHATGHLLYSRFWTKFLKDRGYITFEEPFKKLINQGMIQGRSNFVYRVTGTNKYVSYDLRKEYQTTALHVDVNTVTNDVLDIEKFKVSNPEYNNAEFTLSNGKYLCGSEVEKMSKSKFNVVNPDDIIERYGADTLRMYEMFLGPLEQSKPWNTNGIEGVFKFLRKYWKLFHNDAFEFVVSDEQATKEEYKALHKIIKKVEDDVERFSFNTSVSSFMICVNELTDLKCNKREILRDLTIVLSPYAPHITEECWKLLGEQGSITHASYPAYKEEYLVESEFAYPVSFNGKTKLNVLMPVDITETDAKEIILANADVQKHLEGKELRKFIFVKGKIVNIVC